MGSMPFAHPRVRKTPVPMTGFVRRLPKAPVAMARFVPPSPPKPPGSLAGVMALPPIPIGYVLLFLAMLAGVLALNAYGATYKEALAVVEAILAAVGIFALKQRR